MPKFSKILKDDSIKDYHQELTNKLIERIEESKASLEKGLAWEKPWFTCKVLPFNPATGTKYSGINVISLMTAGFDDPRFFTYRNVKDLAEKTGNEIHVKKGAKGIPVFKAVQITIQDKKDGAEESIENGVKSFWTMKYAGTVFNASQIEGIEPYFKREVDFNPIEEVELLSKALQERTKLEIVHSEVGQAYYNQAAHKVHMPNRDKFKSVEGYYDTLLHEFGHSTGPALGRDLSNGKNSSSYAKEELVAELSSVFMSAELGIPHNPSTHENQAAYLDSWLKQLKSDKNFIFQAASKASKANEYQMEHLREHKIEIGLTQDQEKIKELMKVPIKEKREALTI